MTKTERRNREGRLIVVVEQGSREGISNPGHDRIIAVYDPADKSQREMKREVCNGEGSFRASVPTESTALDYGSALRDRYQLDSGGHNYMGAWFAGTCKSVGDRIIEDIKALRGVQEACILETPQAA